MPKLGSIVLAFVALLIGFQGAACDLVFTLDAPQCQTIGSVECIDLILKQANRGTTTKRNVDAVVAEQNGLQVKHGFSCVEAGGGIQNGKLGHRILEAEQIPSGYDGTVFLNGWDVRFKDKDHHLFGLAVAIADIKVGPRTGAPGTAVSWKAIGLLADHNGDDDYEWCYRYTVLAWPKRASERFDIRTASSTKDSPLIFVSEKVSKASPLRTIYGDFPTDEKGGFPLLAGYGVTYLDDDHHLFQLGFQLGEGRITRPESPPVDFVSWRSRSVFRDNSVRAYSAAEVVSIIRGKSVSVFRPEKVLVTDVTEKKPEAEQSNELRLRARSPDPSTFGASVGTPFPKKFDVVMKDLPFEHAVPMLTGWDLGQVKEDHHVRQVGMSLVSFTEEKTGPNKVTLRCRLEGGLRDKGSHTGTNPRFELSVLGIRRASTTGQVAAGVRAQAATLELAVKEAAPTCDGKAATIIGTAGNDTLTGTDGADVIVGLGGNDKISGDKGNDTLCGDHGDDAIDGGKGTDSCDGGFGAGSVKNCEK